VVQPERCFYIELADLPEHADWVADIRVDMAAMSARMDRIDSRLDRGGGRLDLVPAGPR